MTSINEFTKTPVSVLDYVIDWSEWLASDTILTSVWTVPSELSSITGTFSGTAATIWLSGGIEGKEYAVVNKITTVGGRTEQRTLFLHMRQL